MITLLKSLAPYILLAMSCGLVITALTGKSELNVMFLTALLPLRNVVERMQDYPMGKDFVDIMIAVAILGVFVRIMSDRKNDEIPSGGMTAVHWVAILFVMYTGFAVVNGSLTLGKAYLFSFNDHRVQSWKNFAIMPIMLFLTYASVNNKKTAWMILGAMCGSIFLMDYYAGQQVIWYRGIESRVKINGTFVYLGPNEVAAFYNQYTIIMMAMFFSMKNGLKRTALTVLILLNVYIITFLFSRAAYLGFAFGMVVLFSFKKKILIIPILLAALSWQVVLPEKVVERIQMTRGDYNELDESSALRLQAWDEGLDLFFDNPVVGVGYGVFSRSGFVLGDTHNIYVKILAEQGIIGFLLFLMVLLFFFNKGVTLYRLSRDNLCKGLGLGFAIAIMVLAINNFFGDRWTYMEVGSYMWIIAGIVSKLIIIETQEISKLSPKQIKKKTLSDEFPIG